MKKAVLWFGVMSLTFVFLVGTASAYTFNRRYVNNTGQTAYDLHMLMSPRDIQEVWSHEFSSYTWHSARMGSSRFFELLWWHTGTVPPGGTAWVCFNTTSNKRDIMIASWSDEDGNLIGAAGPVVSPVIRVDDVVIMELAHDWYVWEPTTIPDPVGDSIIFPLSDTLDAPYGTITGTDVAYAYVDEVYPIEELTDSLLSDTSITWTALGGFSINSGEVASYDLGAPGDNLIFRFTATGEGQTSYNYFQYSFGCGDVDSSGTVGAGDVSRIIDYLYIAGTPLTLPEQGDMDGVPGITNNDLAVLIDHIYMSHEPLSCVVVPDSSFPASNDTVSVLNGTVPPGDSSWTVELWLNATEPFIGLSIPFSFECATSSITLDSITSLLGGSGSVKIDNALQRGLVAVNNPGGFAGGDQRLAELHFSVQSSVESQTIILDTTSYTPSHTTVLSRYQGGTPAGVRPVFLGLWPGACCLMDGSCIEVNFASDCYEMAGGNLRRFLYGATCTPNPCRCMKAPKNLLAWWPLDETGPYVATDVAGKHDARHSTSNLGAPGYDVGKVRGAYRVNRSYAYRGMVRTYTDPFKTIGVGDFTIDAWIKPEPRKFCASGSRYIECRLRMIVSNEVGHPTLGSTGFGVWFHALDVEPGSPGRLGLVMWTPWGPKWFTTTTYPVVLNEWQHVAVTVSRTGGNSEGILYHNGVAQGLPFTPIADVMHNPSGLIALDIGHGDPDVSSYKGSGLHFGGLLDEVQIFDRALDSEEIYELWEWGGLGKCRDYCHLRRVITLCHGQTSGSSTLTICNESNDDAHYTWSVSGLPAGIGCTVGGAGMNFIPSASTGIITVGPGQCVQIPIKVYGPPGFAAGDFACYAVTVTNTDTDEEFGCEGQIHITSRYCNHVPPPDTKKSSSTLAFQPDSSGVVEMYKGDTTEIIFIVTNNEDTSGLFNYEVGTTASCDCSAADSIISLNGMEPGTNVTGSVGIPLGDSVTISVSAVLTRFEPFTFQNIVLMSDWEGDGSLDPGGSIAIHPVTFPDCNENGIHDALDIANLTAADTNSNGIPDECEWLQSGSYYTALGGAIVNFEEADSSLTVSNIDTLGWDGVALFPETAQGYHLNWEPLDPGGTLPVGAYMRVGALATTDDLGIISTGTSWIEKTASGWEISAEYFEIGATTQRIDVYLGDEVRATVTGHSGPAVTAAAAPDGWGVELPIMMTTMWGTPTEITVIGPKGAVSVTGDAVRISPEDNTVVPDSLSIIELRMANIPEITFTAHITTPTGCCTGATTGNVDCEGIIDIGDVTVMIQNLFITLNDPCCVAEADIDQSGLVDIGDLTMLISSLFITLNPLGPCP